MKEETPQSTQSTPETMPAKGASKVWMIIAVLAIVALAGLAIFTYIKIKNLNNEIAGQKTEIANLQNTKKTLEDVASAAATAATKTVVNASTKETITGKASYPGSSLPTDEEVCAVSTTDSSQIYCINVGKNQTINYSLEVPAGTYYVYSTASKELNGKAYYNEYSKCGNQSSCPASGHTVYIPVKVTVGSTVSNIDPGDWYAPSITNK